MSNVIVMMVSPLITEYTARLLSSNSNIKAFSELRIAVLNSKPNLGSGFRFKEGPSV